jgi:hypothetical protein
MQVKETEKNPRPGDGTPGPGRPKGTPNRLTVCLKTAILKAAETAGGGEPDGLVNYLVAQAKQNPTPFLSLLGRVLPMQVSEEVDKSVSVTIRQIVEEVPSRQDGSWRANSSAPDKRWLDQSRAPRRGVSGMVQCASQRRADAARQLDEGIEAATPYVITK